jgi:nucleotide-binding universal stress UspA family protein
MFRRVLYHNDFPGNFRRNVACIKTLKPEDFTILHAKKVKKAEKLAKEIGNAKIEVVIGEPWIEIAGRSVNYDLIVLGAFGKSRILEKLLGSTAGADLIRSKCPVLMINCGR